ncbi:PhnD/SsuA/transferrin family substrate-binding protein [Desulfonatronum sp. SC1]|uniref:PhnD/SsuA/transferrin family substrate-binding protein n=1 Tax=Desulfonatronum sp. SC1 TaxID=2109626 RepID=UPI0011B1E18F|nr:PhnD/SsuA/transferrin family substrate-binding protein [Desulfonatronum sp. SC1]
MPAYHIPLPGSLRLRLLGISILLALPLLLSSVATATQPIRFAPLPMESREVIVRAFNPLVAYLEKQLQDPVEMVYFDDRQEILTAFEQDELDLVFLGPLPYVALRQRMPEVEPLVFFMEPAGDARYRCALITFFGDDIVLSELRGQPFGLTSRLSTCGYLGAEAMVRDHADLSLKDIAYRYLGTHEAVIFAVVRGEVVAGSVKDEFAHKYAPLGITIRAYSDWVPATGLFANARTLDADHIQRIRSILLATPPEEFDQWGVTIRHGMAPASDDAYAGFREFGDPAEIP